ncbi:MAG: GDP-mannose 4,6-dehydratase [Archaeoglobaceae archaeon]
MKAFVTGCCGFIGSHLTERLLKEGFEVIGIDCFTDYYSREIKEQNLENISEENFYFMEKDIMDLDEFPEVDYVFHQSAQAGVRKSWGKEFEIYANYNIMATQKLLEFYKARGLKKFVYASSSSVYGDSELPMREDNRLLPISPYGVSKLAGENLCYLYWKNFGVPTVSLRYFTVYGERQRPDMAMHKFIRSIMDGEEITVFGDGEQTRDFTYVGDIVESNLLAARSDLRGEILNVGGGSRISVNSMIKVLEGILGREAKVRYVEKQKGDVRDTLADTNKIERLLGWKPEVTIEEGLKREVEWIKKSFQ